MILLLCLIFSFSQNVFATGPSLGAAIDDHSKGILVNDVFPSTTAEELGLRKNDVIVAVNGTKLKSTDEVISFLKSKKINDVVSFSIERNAKYLILEGRLKGKPHETHQSSEVEYFPLVTKKGTRIAIFNLPKNKSKSPAVLFLGGVGCYSISFPWQPLHPYRQLLDTFIEAGYGVLRIEKSGIGGSKGPDCEVADFQDELEGYVAGINFLNSHPKVKKDKLLLFGHSMGGVFAPVLASRHNVKGIIVAGTLSSTWFEYELANTRRQGRMQGLKAGQLSDLLFLKQRCMHEHLIQEKTSEEVVNKYPDCKELLIYPASDKYMQQVAKINIAALWEKTSANVLAIYGNTDHKTSEEEHRQLASIVNESKNGEAVFVSIPNMSHGFEVCTKKKCKGFNMEARKAISQWLKRL